MYEKKPMSARDHGLLEHHRPISKADLSPLPLLYPIFAQLPPQRASRESSAPDDNREIGDDSTRRSMTDAPVEKLIPLFRKRSEIQESPVQPALDHGADGTRFISTTLTSTPKVCSRRTPHHAPTHSNALQKLICSNRHPLSVIQVPLVYIGVCDANKPLFSMGNGIESSFSRDVNLRTTDRSGQVSRRYRSAIDGSEELHKSGRSSIERDGFRAAIGGTFPSISRRFLSIHESRSNYLETILGGSSVSPSSTPRRCTATAIVRIIIASVGRFRNNVLELINTCASRDFDSEVRLVATIWVVVREQLCDRELISRDPAGQSSSSYKSARQIKSGRSGRPSRGIGSDRSAGSRIARGGTKTHRYFGTAVCRHPRCVVSCRTSWLTLILCRRVTQRWQDERLMSTKKRVLSAGEEEKRRNKMKDEGREKMAWVYEPRFPSANRENSPREFRRVPTSRSLEFFFRVRKQTSPSKHYVSKQINYRQETEPVEVEKTDARSVYRSCAVFALHVVKYREAWRLLGDS
ncbi:hypothetical protein DBV15_11274 [Temnothorax longispinosus]|uniref:Uncharacterized protein n=1 Tax=Temnothorax longispinosus TaxID=300112 RepID=A0A4S2KVU9_9HYME|nr:hypothetical protein DBV15_11274 [Temnothorax longispinosus]